MLAFLGKLCLKSLLSPKYGNFTHQWLFKNVLSQWRHEVRTAACQMLITFMLADFARRQISRGVLCCESHAQLDQGHSLETSRVGGARPGTGQPLPLPSTTTVFSLKLMLSKLSKLGPQFAVLRL